MMKRRFFTNGSLGETPLRPPFVRGDEVSKILSYFVPRQSLFVNQKKQKRSAARHREHQGLAHLPLPIKNKRAYAADKPYHKNDYTDDESLDLVDLVDDLAVIDLHLEISPLEIIHEIGYAAGHSCCC